MGVTDFVCDEEIEIDCVRDEVLEVVRDTVGLEDNVEEEELVEDGVSDDVSDEVVVDVSEEVVV